MKVAVLAGGVSNEREVSLRSGEAVTRALAKAGFDVVVIDPTDMLDSYLDELKSVDVVFPALHGKGGEDGSLQEFLEKHKIKYVGSKVSASKLCFDKYAYYQFLTKNNILMPETMLVSYETYLKSELKGKPHVLKPNNGGSSIDTFIVRNPEHIDTKSIKEVFSRHNMLLLQSLIIGVELTVAVLIDNSLPVIEIVPPDDQEFDYENKYNGATKEICPPENINHDLQLEAMGLASKIHKLCGCLDMSRSDFILSDKKELFVLETNTIPGLTDESLLPKAAIQAGLDMSKLCQMLVEAAASR